MQILRTVILPVFAAALIPYQATRSDPVLVTGVIDGDTMQVQAIGRVRLLGIAAPKTGSGHDSAARVGREAKERLSSLVLRRWVRMERDEPRRGASSWRRAYVILEDGRFVNALLVREGLARVVARQRLSRLAELERAQSEAQEARRGIWRTVERGGMPLTHLTR